MKQHRENLAQILALAEIDLSLLFYDHLAVIQQIHDHLAMVEQPLPVYARLVSIDHAHLALIERLLLVDEHLTSMEELFLVHAQMWHPAGE